MDDGMGHDSGITVSFSGGFHKRPDEHSPTGVDIASKSCIELCVWILSGIEDDRRGGDGF